MYMEKNVTADFGGLDISPAFADAFNLWLEAGGREKIEFWAREFKKLKDRLHHGPRLDAEDVLLPWTKLLNHQRRGLTFLNMKPGQLLVAQVLEAAKESANGKPVVFLDIDLVDMCMAKGKPEKPSSVRKVAKSLGWSVSTGRAACKEWGTTGRAARMIASDEDTSKRSPYRLRELGMTNPTDPMTVLKGIE